MDAGIVDQDVTPSGTRLDMPGNAENLIFVRQVGYVRGDFETLAQELARPVMHRRIPIDHRHPHLLGGQTLGNGEPNASGSAGHHRDSLPAHRDLL